MSIRGGQTAPFFMTLSNDHSQAIFTDWLIVLHCVFPESGRLEFLVDNK